MMSFFGFGLLSPSSWSNMDERSGGWLVGIVLLCLGLVGGGGGGGFEGTSGQHPAADGCCFAQSPLIERK